MKSMKILFAGMICLFAVSAGIRAQATLSFQGILKKSNGVAVDDGTYLLKFKLYDVETGGTTLWETDPPLEVEVTSGIYSVLLNPAGLAFDRPYYLGVSVGNGSEMSPRFLLTQAPYALSLIGESNLFPSSGPVQADRISVKAGGPGSGGYSFQDGGDTDGGLYSTQDGTVWLYSNNTGRLKVSDAGVEMPVPVTIANTLNVTGDQTLSGNLTVGQPGAPKDVTFQRGGGTVYNGFRDWQLVDRDDFKDGTLDGWSVYQNNTGNNWPRVTTLSSIGPTNSVLRNTFMLNQSNNTLIQDYVIAPPVNYLLVKEFDLTGIPHEYVKVNFQFHGKGTWDSEPVFAGFLSGIGVSANFSIDYRYNITGSQIGNGSFGNIPRGEMIIGNSGNKIYVFFASATDDPDEVYAIGNVEVYVR